MLIKAHILIENTGSVPIRRSHFASSLMVRSDRCIVAVCSEGLVQSVRPTDVQQLGRNLLLVSPMYLLPGEERFIKVVFEGRPHIRYDVEFKGLAELD